MSNPTGHGRGTYGPSSGCAARLRRHWLHLYVDVRCALHPHEPQRIERYVQYGSALAQHDEEQALCVQSRMLRTLLATAHDAALPPFWRSTCLEHARPLLDALQPALNLIDPAGGRLCPLPGPGRSMP